MSKSKLRTNYNYREFAKVIEGRGWSLQRSNGHFVYVHPESTQKIVLPHGKGDVPPGIVRKIMAILDGTYYGSMARFEVDKN
jgi:predicted RNA binding protein YcfA (HicA-like mRNA interferase family)